MSVISFLISVTMMDVCGDHSFTSSTENQCSETFPFSHISFFSPQSNFLLFPHLCWSTGIVRSPIWYSLESYLIHRLLRDDSLVESDRWMLYTEKEDPFPPETSLRTWWTPSWTLSSSQSSVVGIQELCLRGLSFMDSGLINFWKNTRWVTGPDTSDILPIGTHPDAWRMGGQEKKKKESHGPHCRLVHAIMSHRQGLANGTWLHVRMKVACTVAVVFHL